MTMSIPPQGKLSISRLVVSYDKNAKESWVLLEDLALYDNESWNDPKDLAKPVKAISLPQDIPSTPDLHLIKVKNQVQRLMEAHLATKSHVQVNKIALHVRFVVVPTTLNIAWKIPSKLLLNTHPRVQTKQEASDARLSKFEADFKQQQGEMTNKIDTFLKAINDRMTGVLPSDTVKNPKLNVNSTSSVLSPKPEEPEKALKDELIDLHFNLPVLEVLAHAPMYNALLDKYVGNLKLGKNGYAFIQGIMPEKMKDLGLFTLPCSLGDSKPFDNLADLGSCVNLIPLYLFKKLKIGLLEKTNHVFGLADGTKSYPVGIVKNVEVHIGRLKLLDDFYIIDMDKDPATPLLVGRGFLATGNAVIDCRKAKIAVGEGITRSIFGVKEIILGDKEIPYWTTLGKRESYKPRPSTDGVGARPLFMLRKICGTPFALGMANGQRYHAQPI
ncbi:MAK10-like protein [Tanacetum coccineum]|uniref:MAK10-like protein n=1 Tax=Tanacetum coccineum TaxID=301880 RepID=A0ABQ5IQN3_9ASTR